MSFLFLYRRLRLGRIPIISGYLVLLQMAFKLFKLPLFSPSYLSLKIPVALSGLTSSMAGFKSPQILRRLPSPGNQSSPSPSTPAGTGSHPYCSAPTPPPASTPSKHPAIISSTPSLAAAIPPLTPPSSSSSSTKLTRSAYSSCTTCAGPTKTSPP